MTTNLIILKVNISNTSELKQFIIWYFLLISLFHISLFWKKIFGISASYCLFIFFDYNKVFSYLDLFTNLWNSWAKYQILYYTEHLNIFLLLI